MFTCGEYRRKDSALLKRVTNKSVETSKGKLRKKKEEEMYVMDRHIYEDMHVS